MHSTGVFVNQKNLTVSSSSPVDLSEKIELSSWSGFISIESFLWRKLLSLPMSGLVDCPLYSLALCKADQGHRKMIVAELFPHPAGPSFCRSLDWKIWKTIASFLWEIICFIYPANSSPQLNSHLIKYLTFPTFGNTISLENSRQVFIFPFKFV